MRYRYVFVAGLTAGFVLGARAGRERYEQLAKLARKVADNPAVQQAAAALQAQAADLAKTTRNKVADRVPKMARTARGKVGAALHERGMRAGDANGRPSADGSRDDTSAPRSPGQSPH
ncbi:MAG TPA: hypothetical protein DHU96_16900 [Actinobacteria bacterium]|nr:hypothetical protein [Actinomycetota bacterium]